MENRRFASCCFLTVALAWVSAGCGNPSGPLEEGASVPDFTVSSAAEPAKSVSMSDLRGKPILVDFWATWCGPCRIELPHIQRLWRENKDKGLQVLAITDQTASEVAAFQSTLGFDLPFYLDEGGVTKKAFGINGLPTAMVIGKSGKVICMVMGAGTLVEGKLDDAVARALQ